MPGLHSAVTRKPALHQEKEAQVWVPTLRQHGFELHCQQGITGALHTLAHLLSWDL